MAVVLDSGVVIGFLDRGDALHGAADAAVRVLPVDVAVAGRAADLRSRFKSLRMPDALILATAETDTDVDLIVTGDRQLTKVSGLRVDVRLPGWAETAAQRPRTAVIARLTPSFAPIPA